MKRAIGQQAFQSPTKSLTGNTCRCDIDLHCRPSRAQCRSMNMIKTLIAVLLIVFACATGASDDLVRDTAERYVRTQTHGLPGAVSVQVGQLDASSRLPPCTSLEGYTPSGARLWGKTHVGVRCLGPNAWSILLPVNISVTGNYLVTARPLTAGQVLQASDLLTMRGDLASLPSGVVTEVASAIGKSLKNSLAAGQPLRAEILLAPLLVKQGQSVKLIARGDGFTVSSEGKALNNASAGQVVQIRVASGQIISGIVLSDGTVEINR